MTFNERLKMERLRRNLTQTEMGLAMDMLQSQYSVIEKGTQSLTMDKLALLHNRLGVDLNYLITGNYTKLNYGLDKMPFSEIKKLNHEIFKELDKRINEYETGTKTQK
ncbi:helix-turn-helix domain-containing protein [Flavobacteriaceae bacterium Ap0902]|nr:helix-turn-helix domain-containing protein [Flavobacteriaceae bacterium Ap0902]